MVYLESAKDEANLVCHTLPSGKWCKLEQMHSHPSARMASKRMTPPLWSLLRSPDALHMVDNDFPPESSRVSALWHRFARHKKIPILERAVLMSISFSYWSKILPNSSSWVYWSFISSSASWNTIETADTCGLRDAKSLPISCVFLKV